MYKYRWRAMMRPTYIVRHLYLIHRWCSKMLPVTFDLDLVFKRRRWGRARTELILPRLLSGCTVAHSQGGDPGTPSSHRSQARMKSGHWSSAHFGKRDRHEYWCLFMTCVGNFEFKASIVFDLLCQPKGHVQKSILLPLHPLALSYNSICSDMNDSAHLLSI